MKKQDDPKVTRRKLLSGAGALGFLTLTTGLGRGMMSEPVAFNRSMTVEGDNGLDLRLDWRETYNGEVVEGEETLDEHRNNVSEALLDLGGVMPGDSGTVVLTPTILDSEGNPTNGRLYMYTHVGEEPYRENGVTEPEEKAGDDTPNQGELQDYIDLTVWYDSGMMVSCDGNFNIDEPVIIGGNDSQNTLFDIIEESDSENPIPIDDCLRSEEELCLGLKWSIPEEIGNIIQTDSVDFGLTFGVTPCDSQGGSQQP